MCVCMYVCMCVCMCVCMYVCVCVCVFWMKVLIITHSCSSRGLYLPGCHLTRRLNWSLTYKIWGR